MKLVFTKSEENEIAVQFQNGTVLENFSYTAMIKKLLDENKFEENIYNGLDQNEIDKVEKMLEKIIDVFKEEILDDEILEEEDDVEF